MTSRVTLEAAKDEALSLSRRWWGSRQDDLGNLAFVTDLHSYTVGNQNATIFILFGIAMALLLLIAGANLTNLLLIRALVRRSETTLRRAFGASNWSIARRWSACLWA